MAERDFTIGDRKFKLGKINALKQYHIVRRIAPILAELLPGIKDVAKLNTSKELSESDKFEQISRLAGPLLMGLSKLSDEDSNKVLMGLLNSVEVNANGAWAYVAVEDRLMFEDMDLPVLLQAAGRAFLFNLSGFFAALPRV